MQTRSKEKRTTAEVTYVVRDADPVSEESPPPVGSRAAQVSETLPVVEEVVKPELGSGPGPTSVSPPSSPSEAPNQADQLFSALKRFGKMKSEGGKLHEPEPFTGRDPKKLKAFIFQCQLYFRNSSDYDDESRRVTFALSYLRDVAQEWFEPGISGLTDAPPPWLDDWEAFLDELRTNFGPYDEIGDAEHELTNLRMRDNQRVSDYLVRFSSLAVRCPWGDAALRFRFYDGLPPRIKDELSKGDKPRSLLVMKQKVQNIDARYWERNQERSREQQRQNPPKASGSTSTANPTTTPKAPARSDNRSDPKPSKPRDSKPTTPRVDLSGKLDSKGKLTQQERQRRIDHNLCLFCGGSGHRSDNCPIKAAKARAATTQSVPAPTKPKESGTEKKKD